MDNKRLVTLIVILIIGLLLLGCSKKAEPVVNKNTTQAEEPINEEPDTPLLPAEENSSTGTEETNTTENLSLPEENESEEVPVVPDVPSTPPDEEYPVQNDDKCIKDLSEICAGPPKLNCVEKADFEPDEKTITFVAKNEFGSEILLNDFTSYDEEEPWSCMTRLMVDNVEVSIDGSEAVNINTQPSVRNEGVIKFIIKYSGTDKGYIDQKFALSYTTDNRYESYYLIRALKD